MEFRRAESAELDRVRGFYWALIDIMEGGEFDPGWRKGIYPSDAELRKSLDAGELYVLEDEGAITPFTPSETEEQEPPRRSPGRREKSKKSFLENFCVNLTEKAQNGEMDRIIGRDSEIYRVIQILSRPNAERQTQVRNPGPAHWLQGFRYLGWDETVSPPKQEA